MKFVEPGESLETEHSGERFPYSHASAGEKQRRQRKEIYDAKGKNHAER
jgi:hypothetical protein